MMKILIELLENLEHVASMVLWDFHFVFDATITMLFRKIYEMLGYALFAYLIWYRKKPRNST